MSGNKMIGNKKYHRLISQDFLLTLFLSFFPVFNFFYSILNYATGRMQIHFTEKCFLKSESKDTILIRYAIRRTSLALGTIMLRRIISMA